MKAIDMLNAVIQGKMDPPPIAKLIGMRLISVSQGQAIFELEAGKEHASPLGTLHGGVLCDLGDAAMGCAVATTLAEGQSYTTIELGINFFKPIWKSTLTAVGTVVRKTRKTAYAEADVRDDQDSLVAKLSSTCLYLDHDDAQGR